MIPTASHPRLRSRFTLIELVPVQKRFTLIELLVVVAIIAVLAAMLLPALQNARLAAKRALCLNHQKQVYLATAMYEDDNETVMPMSRRPKKAFGETATAGYVPGTNPLLEDPRPYTIGFGLLTWNGYVNEQAILGCPDTVYAPINTDSPWHYPHLALTPTGGNSWDSGHRPPFTFPMRGKRPYLSSGKTYGGVSSFAMRRWNTIRTTGEQVGYDIPSQSYIDFRPLRMERLTKRFQVLMLCNQSPGNVYETCHQGVGSNILYMDGSAKWGHFRGVQRTAWYAFDYPFGSHYPGNSLTNIWGWAEGQY